MTKQYSVYWIHLPEHTDITSQGYIGITSKSVHTRFIEHKSASKSYDNVIHRVFRKYKDILIVTELVKGNKKYCALVEFKLRPEKFIGWNSAIGGYAGSPPSEETRRKLSMIQKALKGTAEARRKMSVTMAGRVPSQATREAAIAYLKSRLPWEHPSAVKRAWLSADVMYEIFTVNKNVSDRGLSTPLGLTRSQVRVILKKFQAGWNPLTDTAWLVYKENNKEINNASS